MGSNMAEAHPVGFQWVVEAKARGAKVIHIDPHFTRTSALADTFVPIRVGSDIAFLGGVIRHILENGLDFREYVTAYTNAAALISPRVPRHRGPRRAVQRLRPGEGQLRHGELAVPLHRAAARRRRAAAGGAVPRGRCGRRADRGRRAEETDPTLQHPDCVYQILKRHFARYTPEFVEEVCGVPQDAFRAVCDAWTANSGRERTTTLIYSVGWTQHSVGAQYIRAGSIVQLLLGNIGRPGGGILALRGHASIQGSTDIPTLFNLLPGYLPMPSPATPDLDAYVESIRSRKQKGFWYAADAYMVSLLKEYWGEGATADNDYRFDYLPRIDGDHGVFRTALDMVEGKVPGYFVFGQNPAVAVSNGRLMRLAMAQLDWMVVRDLAMIETATFWKDAPEVETGEIVPEECRTEVFFFPAASHVEKEGTFTQTERMLQWREQAVEPVDDQRSDLWFTYHLGRLIRERLAGSADERDRPIVELNWDLPVHGDPVWGEPDAEEVLRRINGYHLRHRRARRRLPPAAGRRLARRRAAGSTRGCSRAG